MGNLKFDVDGVHSFSTKTKENKRPLKKKLIAHTVSNPVIEQKQPLEELITTLMDKLEGTLMSVFSNISIQNVSISKVKEINQDNIFIDESIIPMKISDSPLDISIEKGLEEKTLEDNLEKSKTKLANLKRGK